MRHVLGDYGGNQVPISNTSDIPESELQDSCTDMDRDLDRIIRAMGWQVKRKSVNYPKIPFFPGRFFFFFFSLEERALSLISLTFALYSDKALAQWFSTASGPLARPFARWLIGSSCSLICLLHTVHYVCTLRSAHSFTRLLPSSWERGFSS